MSVSKPLFKGAEQPIKAIALMLAAVFLFSSHDTLSKYLSGFYPIVMVVWIRYVVHTLLMLVIFVPRTGFSTVVRTKRPGLQLLRALCLIGVSLLFTTGLRYIPLAEATSVVFLAPLLVTALSVPLLGERVTRAQWLAVLAGFIGVLIAVRPGGALFTPAILLPLAAALCFGFYQLLTRMLSGIDSPTTSNFLTGILNSLIMTAILPFFWTTPTLVHGLFMIGLGTCGMFGHMLMTQAFRHAAPAMLAPFSYGQILFAGLYGYLIFDHTPDRFAVVGITVICLSGLAVAWAQRKKD